MSGGTFADPTTRDGLEEILRIARSAAHEAGSLVQRGFRRAPAVEHKGAVDLVTQFDKESEALVRKRLAEALPFAIIGEEAGGTAASTAFYVDPIDGTTNFVHGHPFWCISIGLVVDNEPVLGVVVAPELGIEWLGWIAASGESRAVRRSASNALIGGEGSSVTEGPCRVSTTSALLDALLATGFPYDRRTSADNNFDAFVAIKKRCQAVRRCGSAAIDLCLVADGTYDGYWERKLRPWDIAAGIAIVRAAGGRVSDFDGGATFLTSGSVIATNGALHDTLATELARSRGGA